MKAFSLGYRARPLPIDESRAGYSLDLTASVAAEVGRLLPKSVAGVGHENALYLAGVIDGKRRVACLVIAPPIVTSPTSYDTDVSSHAAVVELLAELDLAVVAQIHSHPGEAVYHSDGDDELAFIKGEGFWSIVVPNYAKQGMTPLETCGFHCFSDGEFRMLSPDAVSVRVRIMPANVDLRKAKG